MTRLPSWARHCRQCGAKPVPGRAWCKRCLGRIERGMPTDLDEYPKPREGFAETEWAFPFWPGRS